MSQRSFSTRLCAVLALLLLAYGAFVAVLGRQVMLAHEQESQQRLLHGLARHIVDQWPQLTRSADAPVDAPVDAPAHAPADGGATRAALLRMLQTVNPGVQVYLLDAEGRVQHYIGQPGMVREHQVDLGAVRAFLQGADLPLRGTDPMGSGQLRIFSAAMFPPRAGDSRPPGYLYVVLDSAARAAAASQVGRSHLGWGLAAAAATGLLVTLGLGLFSFRRLTLPLHRLARKLRGYQRLGSPAAATAPASQGDEVAAIRSAFDEMTRRLEDQAQREQRQVADHREMMASVAHDLRTPLTALHGHLEALQHRQDAAATAPGDDRPALLQAALAQSRKVSRLSQQLFELAALQSTDQVLHRERFSLDEVVTDAVQKFSLGQPGPAVTLDGVPPGRLELDGDLQLIERALTNLIDNALRHAPGNRPVRVSLQREGEQAQIVVDDAGPGLPAAVHQRLDQGQSLRDPPIRRSSGGIGGLGLAIAQRVAVLHGGSLRPLPAPTGGTRLCLALPLSG